MPALPDLPLKNSSLIDSSATNALYTKATREYVNRDFASALSTIATLRQQQSQTLKSKRRVIFLYVAVLEAITLLDETELKSYLGREGVSVAEKLQLGTIWPELRAFFDGIIPLDVSAHTIIALSRHTKVPERLQGQVEELLTGLDPDSPEYDSVSEIYALHVLPCCQQWDAARGFIEAGDMSEEKRQTWLDTLGHIRSAQEKQKVRDAQEAEDARKAELEAKKLKKIRKSRTSGGSKKSSTSVNGSASGSTILPGSKTNNNDQDKINDPDLMAVTPPTRSSAPPSILQRLSRTLLSIHLNSQILKLLFFLAVLFGAAGRRAIRERIQRGLIQTRRTIGMAFKVSFV